MLSIDSGNALSSAGDRAQTRRCYIEAERIALFFLGWCGRIISYWKSFAAGSGLYRRRLSLRPFILKKEEKNVKPIRLFLLPAAAAAVMLSPLILKGTDEKFRFSGVENQAQFPEITAQKLLDGQAQTEFEAYVQQHLPGKPFMVRLRNEITVFSAGYGIKYQLQHEVRIRISSAGEKCQLLPAVLCACFKRGGHMSWWKSWNASRSFWRMQESRCMCLYAL